MSQNEQTVQEKLEAALWRVAERLAREAGIDPATLPTWKVWRVK